MSKNTVPARRSLALVGLLALTGKTTRSPVTGTPPVQLPGVDHSASMAPDHVLVAAEAPGAQPTTTRVANSEHTNNRVRRIAASREGSPRVGDQGNRSIGGKAQSAGRRGGRPPSRVHSSMAKGGGVGGGALRGGFVRNSDTIILKPPMRD